MSVFPVILITNTLITPKTMPTGHIFSQEPQFMQPSLEKSHNPLICGFHKKIHELHVPEK